MTDAADRHHRQHPTSLVSRVLRARLLFLAAFLVCALVSGIAEAVTFTAPKGGFSYVLGKDGEPVCVTWPAALHDAAQCAALKLPTAAPPDPGEQHDALVGVALVHREELPFTALASSMPRRFRALTSGELPRDQRAIQELAAAALPSEGEILWESPGGEPAFQKLDQRGVPVFRVVAVQNGMSYVMFLFEHAKGTGLVQVLGPRTLYPKVQAVSDEVLASLTIEPPPKAAGGSLLTNADGRARLAPWILAPCAAAAAGTVMAFLADRRKRSTDPRLGALQSRSGLAAHGALLFVLAAFATTALTDLVIFGDRSLTWLGRLQGLCEIAALALAAFTLITWRAHKKSSHAWIAVASIVIVALVFGFESAATSDEAATSSGATPVHSYRAAMLAEPSVAVG